MPASQFPVRQRVHNASCIFVLDVHVHRVHIRGMTLAEFMEAEGLDDLGLAIKVNRDRSNVLRWRTGKTRPDFDALVAIENLSGGKVTARDFAKDAG